MSLYSQISEKDRKIVNKANNFFEKGNFYKAIDKLDPLLEKYNDSGEIWSLMIKYHIKRYENNLNQKGNSLVTQTSAAVRGIYYEDLVKLLQSATTNCKSIEGICNYLVRMKEFGAEKSFKTNDEKSYYEVYENELKGIEEKKCRT